MYPSGHTCQRFACEGILRPHDAIMPAPVYALARAACPTLVIWHADGRFTRHEGAPCEEYAGALGVLSKIQTVV